MLILVVTNAIDNAAINNDNTADNDNANANANTDTDDIYTTNTNVNGLNRMMTLIRLI